MADPRQYRGGPGIRVPPPFVFIAWFGLGWWLNTRIEFLIDQDGPGAVQTVAGAVMGLAGFGLMFWGIGTFLRARTAVIPIRAARTLVIHGPYRFTRNPMYVGFATAYTGLALVFNLAWPLLLLPLAIVTMNVAIISREERHLRAAFESDYDAYCRRVRRWI